MKETEMDVDSKVLEKKTMRLTKFDIEWIAVLYGSAIGAGILFLPLQAISSGFVPLVISSICIFPMVYLSHKLLSNIVLFGKIGQDLTGVFTEFMGNIGGLVSTILYFLTMLSIMLGYAVALPTVFSSFFTTFHITKGSIVSTLPERMGVSFIIFVVLIGIMVVGKKLMLRVNSYIIVPLVVCLLGISIILIPHWNFAVVIHASSKLHFFRNLLLIFPILFFAMFHAQAVSEYAQSYRDKIPNEKLREKKATRVLLQSNIVILFFTLFFVFSCVLAVPKANAIEALATNSNVLTVISEVFSVGFLHYVGPIIAITAIVSSFFGTFLGTRESMNGLFVELSKWKNPDKKINMKKVDGITILIIFVMMWFFAVENLKVVSILGMMSAPLMAILLFILPVIVIYKGEKYKRFRNKGIIVFYTVSALVIMLGYVFGSLIH